MDIVASEKDSDGTALRDSLRPESTRTRFRRASTREYLPKDEDEQVIKPHLDDDDSKDDDQGASDSPPRKRSRRQHHGENQEIQEERSSLTPSSPPSSSVLDSPKCITVDDNLGHQKKRAIAKARKAEAEDMDWVCALCKEADCLMEPDADEFLICDGGCHRVFHYPCAGLSSIPKRQPKNHVNGDNSNNEDDDEKWFCQDCTQSRHACAFCHEYGQDHTDVFPCRRDNCGLFFHESCLALNNVTVKMQPLLRNHSKNFSEQDLKASSSPFGGNRSPNNVEADPLVESNKDALPETMMVPIFTCPAHQCWTCTQNEELQREQQEAEARKREMGKKKNTKKKRGGIRAKSIFTCKTEGRTFRCLYCPMAYHVTCLPPTTKVNELGVLCPDHALTHKLPDLDLSSSIQRRVEARIDRQLDKVTGTRRRLISGLVGVSRGGSSANPFFPGLRGDKWTATEKLYFDHVAATMDREDPTPKDDEEAMDVETTPVVDLATIVAERMGGGLPFCLPVDIRTEVHSKPPNYTHVHGLRYDPTHRPKKLAFTGEQCQCVEACDDRCFNRMSLFECCGDGPNSNCGLGSLKCTNRGLGRREFVKCKPQRESGKGWGLITECDIPEGKLVQEYVGEVIDEVEKERRLIEWNMEHPNDPNFYVMGLGIGWYVDAREYANMSRFINHSCDPNCEVRTMKVKGWSRNGIYALRDIKAGEFLSYDYNFDTNQADRFACRCGAINCRGTMQGGGGGATDGPDKKVMTWREAKLKYDNDVKELNKLNQKKVISQVDALVPAADKPTELVANGPNEKHRGGPSSRLFLWRNVLKGSNFVARQQQLFLRQRRGQQPDQDEPIE